MKLHHLTTTITFTATLVAGVQVATSQPPAGWAPYRQGSLMMPADGLPSASAMRQEQRLERAGMVCTEAARLTDAIIVDVDGRARMVTMKQAFRLARAGGWVRAYCTDA